MVVCIYQKYYKKSYNKATIDVNELTLTPFIPFDIKCKKLNLIPKTSWNVFYYYILHKFFSDFMHWWWNKIRKADAKYILNIWFLFTSYLMANLSITQLKYIFWTSRRVSFSYFPKVAFNHGGCPPIPFRIFMNHVIILSLSYIKHLRWSSLWQKISNNWELLLTVATESFILNMTGLVDPTLKQTDKFRLRQQYFIWHLHVHCQQNNTTKQCQTY